MAKKTTLKKKTEKTPIALVLTDIHLTKDNGALVKDIISQALSLCKKRSISTIIISGDIFTNRSGQPLSCLTDWADILNDIRSANRMLVVIPGNHDKTDANSEKSYLDIFTYYPNVRVVSNAISIPYGNIAVGLIPYFGEEKWLEEYERLEDIVESQFIEEDLFQDASTVLITHMGVEGVKNNDGTEVISAIKPKRFKSWDKVLIGHYHNASKLGDNIYYIGSAYQNDFGENCTDKGFTILYDNADIEFIPSRFPRYIKEVIDVNDTETLRNIVEKYEGEEYDHIRLVFRGKKVDAKKVNMAELSARGFSCVFESREETEAVEIAEGEEIVSMDKRSILKNFLNFCSENGIKGKKLMYGMKLVKSL